MPVIPIDPLTGPRYALEGRVVTMNENYNVLDKGVVYIDAGRIIAVNTGTPPSGYEDVPIIKTRGTIYPGLIELHNHLSYNILKLWDVPKKYTNRDQWGGTETYQKLISGPMKVLGKIPEYVPAIVRYVECKCLLSGVTTSQGIALYSNQGITRYYRGIVRNVEQTDDADLPEANARIADVEATDAKKFLARLQRSSCLLLHLSEGVDKKAHQHFEALNLGGDAWAISPALAGIHCVSLELADFQTLSKHGGAMVWSPLSNLLLYGKTADIKAAKFHGVLIGIGSDWSLTGSKNLLGELKVARLVSEAQGNVFTDRELLAMATRNAAEILKWDKVLGSIEVGKRADLLVMAGKGGDPYAKLLESNESAITLVIINGMPRYGTLSRMKHFEKTENLSVGGKKRAINLKQATADPVVGALKLSEARKLLKEGLQKMPELARRLEQPPPRALRAAVEAIEPQWFLMLEHDEPGGLAMRPHLPFKGLETALMPKKAFAVPLSELLEPMELDSLTVADDRNYLDCLVKQSNLPEYVKGNLSGMY